MIRTKIQDVVLRVTKLGEWKWAGHIAIGHIDIRADGTETLYNGGHGQRR